MDRKLVRWFLLSIKRQLGTWSFWGLLFLLIMVQYMLFCVIMPDQNHAKILLYAKNSKDLATQNIISDLTEHQHIFSFEMTETEDDAVNQVKSQAADCGFIFPEDFTKRLQEGSTKGCVTCLSTPAGIRMAVAEEIVFASIYREYGKILLTKLAEGDQIYTNHPDNQLQTVLSANEKYLNNGSTFSFAYEQNQNAGATPIRSLSVEKPVRGIIASFLFLAALFIGGGILEEKGVYLILSVKKMKYYRGMELAGRMLPLAVAGLICIYSAGVGTSILTELLKMLFFLVLCVLWILLYIKLNNSTVSYYCTIPILLLLCLLLTPVFFHMENYIPAARMLKWLFPVTYYLL